MQGDDAWGRRWKKRLRPPEVDVPLSGDDLHPMGKDVVWNKAKAAEVGASMPDEEKARIWELYKRHEAAVAYLQENITVPHVHLPEVYSPLR